MRTGSAGSRRRRRNGRGARDGIAARLTALGGLANGRSMTALAAGLVLAVLAFGQAAAQNGIAVGLFRPLGPSFYAWRADQVARDLAFAKAPTAIPGVDYVAVGRDILRDQPLTAPAMRTVAWGYAAQGQVAKATSAMRAAESISRRDTQAQSWLLVDVAKRGDVAASLHHFDVLLRVEPSLRPELLPRLASVLGMPDARQALRPLLKPDTPWFEGFTIAAVNSLPRVAPLAEMILEQRSVPDSPTYRVGYARLVQRLVEEREIGLLQRVYPRLPGVDPSTMRSASLEPKQFESGYMPFTWTLVADSDWGGSLVAAPSAIGQAGLEGFADPGTRGTVASKFVMLPAGDARLAWRVLDRAQAPGADGYWQVTCIAAGQALPATRSENMFAGTRRDGMMSLPQGCPSALIELVIAGGTSGTSPSLTVGNLAVSAAARSR